MATRRGRRVTLCALGTALLVLSFVQDARAADPTLLVSDQLVDGGDLLTVGGAGYTFGSPVELYLDNVIDTFEFASVATDASGAIVPGSTITLPGAGNGPHLLYACVPAVGDPPCTDGLIGQVTLQFGPAPDFLTVTPDPAVAGAPLAITAGGFQVDKEIGVFLDGDFTTPPLFQANSLFTGTIAGDVPLPPGLAPGSHELVACRLDLALPPLSTCWGGNDGPHLARHPITIPAPPAPPVVPVVPLPPLPHPAAPTTTAPEPPPRTTTTTQPPPTTTTSSSTTTTTTVPTTPTTVADDGDPEVALAPRTVERPAGLGDYDPTAHARTVVELQVAAFTLLALGGLSPAAAGAAGAGRHGGRVASAKADRDRLAGDGEGPGDRSRTWRWPGTDRVDLASRVVPRRTSPVSPLLARVLLDGSYLRAMFGAASTALPVLGLALGALALLDVEGQAVPPGLALMVLLPVLGVLDALAGLLAVSVLVVGVGLSGGIADADSMRTMLGLAALCFAAPLIASAARPLRRDPARSSQERFDHLADFAIASLVGAWAVQKMVVALPGLAGTELSIAERANVVALCVLAALIVRMLAETATVHWYPARLTAVHPEDVPWAGSVQRLAAAALRTTIFAFVAYAFVGPRWQLVVGTVLFALPQVLKVYEDRFPSSERLHQVMPRGIVKTVLMLAVGALVAALLFSGDRNPDDLIADGFVILSLPGLLLALLGLIGRDGEERALGWLDRLAGLGILVAGVALVLNG